jgi:hypothetical protein
MDASDFKGLQGVSMALMGSEGGLAARAVHSSLACRRNAIDAANHPVFAPR